MGGGEQGPRRGSSGEPNLSLSLTQLYKHMSTRLAQRAHAHCRAPHKLHGSAASGGGKDAPPPEGGGGAAAPAWERLVVSDEPA